MGELFYEKVPRQGDHMNKWIVLLILLSLFNFAATCEKAPEVAKESEPIESESYLDDETLDTSFAINIDDEEDGPEEEEPGDENPEPETEEGDDEQSL